MAEPVVEPVAEVPKMKNIQYLACGYDLMEGNPLPTKGVPMDPGYKDPIFELKYDDHSISADGRFLQPDHTMIKGTKGSCSLEASTDIVSSVKQYEKTLSHLVSADFKGWGASFSMSNNYQQVHKSTKEYHRTFTMTKILCATYIADLHGGDDGIQMSERFINFVKKLPLDYESNKDEYAAFVEQFGTHYVEQIVMGSLYGMQTQITQESMNELNEKQNDLKLSAGYGMAGQFQVDVGYEHSSHEKKKEEFMEKAIDKEMITIGKTPPSDGKAATWIEASVKDPAPIKNVLRPISNLLRESYYGKQFSDNGVSMEHLKQVQTNLNQYYTHYCDSNPGGFSCSSNDVDPAHECPIRYYKVDNDLIGSGEDEIRDTVPDLNACSIKCDERSKCVAFEYNWVEKKCITYESKKLGKKENRFDRDSTIKSCIMSLSYAGLEAISRRRVDRRKDMQMLSKYKIPHDGLLKSWEFYSAYSGGNIYLQIFTLDRDKYTLKERTEVVGIKKGFNSVTVPVTVDEKMRVKKGQVIGWYSSDKQPIVFDDKNCESIVTSRKGELRKGKTMAIKGKKFPRCYSIRAVIQTEEDEAKAIDRYTRVRAHHKKPELHSKCDHLDAHTMREDGSKLEQCAEMCSDYDEECTGFMYRPDGARGTAHRCVLLGCAGGMSDLKLSPGKYTWDIYIKTEDYKGELHLALGDRQDGYCQRATDSKDSRNGKVYRGRNYNTMKKCYNFCRDKKDIAACEFTKMKECVTFEENVGSASHDSRYKCWIMGKTQYYTSDDPKERCVTHNIRTESQCQEAVHWIDDGHWKGSISEAESPQGCIVEKKRSKKYIYWNTNCADNSHNDRGVVCRSMAVRNYELNPVWDLDCNVAGIPQGEEPGCKGCDSEATKSPNSCWSPCRKKAGYCKVCNSDKGTRGACCRLNEDGSRANSGKSGECDAVPDEAFPFLGFHTCVLVPTGIEHSTVRETAEKAVSTNGWDVDVSQKPITFGLLTFIAAVLVYALRAFIVKTTQKAEQVPLMECNEL